jgi:predicted deacylase
MASKKLEIIEVRDDTNGVVATIPLGIVEGYAPGRSLGVIGGAHGTEYAAHDAVARFWDSLDPEKITGTVRVVLMADTIAFEKKSAYVNPADGKNLNRVWPGDYSGTITEVIAATITERVVSKSDAVIDVHGGEWDEAIGTFIIAHSTGVQKVDDMVIAVAKASGFPFIEVTPADGAILGKGTGSGTACMAGVPAMTFEAGGEGLREERYIDAHFEGLWNVGRYLGILDGEITTWSAEPVVMDHGVLMKVKAGGVLRPEVEVGDWIAEGQVFTSVLTYDGEVVEVLTAPEAGVVIDVINSRAIAANGFAGKIAVLKPRMARLD